MAQVFVGTPVFCEFDRGAAQVAVVLLELRLKAAEKRESVGGRPGKSGEDFLLIEATNFLGFVLDHRLAESYLTVARHHDLVVATNAEDSGGTDSARRAGVVLVFELNWE